jgi:hypothetical protein
MLLVFSAAFAHAGSLVGLTRAMSLLLLALQHSDIHLDENSIFSILIALVFGFSTLNILGLVSKRFENRPGSLNLGEVLALTAMALSICCLGWEMLQVFHVFPIKLER